MSHHLPSQCMTIHGPSWSQPRYLSLGSIPLCFLKDFAPSNVSSLSYIMNVCICTETYCCLSHFKPISQPHFCLQLCPISLLPFIATVTISCRHTESSLPFSDSLQSDLPSPYARVKPHPQHTHDQIQDLILTLHVAWPNNITWPWGSWFPSWNIYFLEHDSWFLIIGCSFSILFVGSYLYLCHPSVHRSRAYPSGIFTICTHPLGDLIQAQRLKYHICADDPWSIPQTSSVL